MNNTELYIDTLIKNNLPLAKRIRRKNNVNSSSDKAYSFIISSLKIFYPNISDHELELSITDNENDAQIDAIIIQDSFVDIYDFKNNRGYGINDIRLFVESLNQILFNTDSDLNNFNNLIQQRIPDAWRAIENGNNVRVRVVRKGNEVPQQGIFTILNNLDYDNIVEKKCYNGENIISLDLNLIGPPINYNWSVRIKFDNCIFLPKTDTDSCLIRTPILE